MSKQTYRIAVVGATSPLGKEIGDEIAESPLATATILLLDSEDAGGTLEAMGDEATFIQPLEPAALENVDVAIFTDARMMREHGRTAQQLGAAVVDATGTADRSVPVRSPLAAEIIGENAPLGLETTVIAVAHPVSTMLATVLGRAATVSTVRSVAGTVLQPASEGGSAALDELQQQTISLLSFQSVPKDEYDAQVAFNLLPAFGQAAKASLADAEARVLHDLGVLSSGRVPAPLLQVIQAPVFHGFAVALFVELERSASVDALSAALAIEGVDLVSEDGDPPSNLSAAGQGQILLQVKPSADAEQTRFALWMTADNLKLAARTAVACALELTKLRPLGTVQ